MAEIGKYIYGVIPRHSSGEVDSNTQEYFGPYGITACEDVYAISYQDVSTIVSDSEIIDYTCMLKDTLARLLLRHQKVIERVMGLGCTVIPVRLGTFVKDEDEVRDILDRGHNLIKDVLTKISDKIEIDVAVTWSDMPLVLKEASAEEEIKEFKEKLLANPKEITLDDQMKVGVMVKKALDRKRERCAKEIEKALKIISQDFKTHGLMDDKMVTNSAFLIEKAKREDFDRKVEELNTEFDEKLNFRCVGPLPPYSFYTLEVKKMQFKDLDWARKKLGLLNEFATKNEIKKAHQTMALITHPDRNPNITGIEGEFDEVTRAYRVLWEYCQGDSCSFNEEEFKKNAILVKVRD